ncbi:MAG: asparagine synthase (glutamine-hydrolyzing) [Actinomycetota bacterium]|nr:asparagine synthase (glutamine-hydrolyzing) [Actinomycetota bacterium]
MLRRLAHRGPDDEGEVTVNGAWLGHRRLSIVDVESGHQPLSNEAGDLFLVGNGEVYNHEELRDQLGGHRFATSSDNEVALHLLDERGPECLGDMHGMYAFLAAGEDGRFLAARDPVGIKPLFWARRGEQAVFASELGAFDRELLPEVEVFPPGFYWTPEEGLRRFARAVPRTELEPEAGPRKPGAAIPDDILRRTREVVTSSVEGQMMGDVPVGVLLSGGLDSNIVAAIAARYLECRGERLKTFTVGTEGSVDLLAAREVAEALGSEHHECIYTAEELVEALPETVRAIESFDPSLVRSAVPNYLLARFTARHVKVVLTGEGADEIFAGYEYLRRFRDVTSLQAELVRTVESLHNLNLQRCDRVTMAHGLEARVPFLERDVIAFGLGLAPGWKLAAPDQREKRLLRLAFRDLLPERFLWREKWQFGNGSGAGDVLRDRWEDTVSDADFVRERDAVEPPLRTKEELAYYRIFREHLKGVRPERTISRFATA